jgi:hypothetical protein
MILLWGVPGDPPLDAVYRALLLRGAPILLIDQRHPEETAVAMNVAERLRGTISIGRRDIQLEDISGVYVRPQDRSVRKVFGGAIGSPSEKGEALDDTLLIVAELAPAIVLNRPEAMAANSSKPYQYSQIRSAGFAVPETLITTSPETAREFLAKHGRVIYKSISGVRSIVGELGVSAGARIAEVCWCPTQLQERIRGVDVRVHVVGDEIFACEIISEAVDYRYAHLTGHSVQIRPCKLPVDCAERCLELSKKTQLPLAGIDLRRTSENQWYCFEVNPSPGFTFYQQATGAPIDTAIASLLAP